MTDDLKKLAEAATPGPWEPRDGRNLRAPAACIDFAVVCPVEGKEVARVWTEDDARFIAAANPTAILALIRERDAALTTNTMSATSGAFYARRAETAERRADAAEAALSAAREEVEGLKKQITSTALDALAADGQAHESYAAAMALHERLTAILDWCDLAADQPSTFNQQGVKLLQGPVFDDARKAVADHAIYAQKEPHHG